MLKRALKLNTYSIASQGAVLITGVLFAVILSRLVSVTDYGLLTSFISFVVFITILSDMGLRTTATKYVGDAFFSKKSDLWKYITQLTTLRFILVISMGIAVFLLAEPLSRTILHDAQYAFVFQFTGIVSIIYSAMHFFEGLVSAANRYEYTFAGSAITNVGRLVLPIIAVMFISPTAEWAIAGVAGGYLLGAVSYSVFFRRVYGFKFEWSGGLGEEMKRYAIYAALIGWSVAFFSYFDTVLLNAFLSPDRVALYKAAQQVLIGVVSLAPISYFVIFTFFVELEANKKRKEQVEAYAQALKYGLVFFIPVSVMMFVLSSEIIGFLFLPTYAASARALQAFAALPAFYFLFNVNMNALFARGEIRPAAGLYILAAILSVALNVFLIPIFGFVGSAITYSAAFIAPTIISIPLLMQRLSLGINLRALVKPFLASAVATASVLFVKSQITGNELLLIILFPAVCAAVYLALLDDDDRRVLKALVELFRGKERAA